MESNPGLHAKAALTRDFPAVTLTFWIIKVAATTLGETGGDTVTMTWDLGYLVGTADLSARAPCWCSWRCRSRQRSFILFSIGRPLSLRRRPARRWPILPIARSASVMRAVPAAFRLRARDRWRCGICRRARFPSDGHTPRVEIFYWATITFSQTLGRRWATGWPNVPGLGYVGGAGCSARRLA